MPAGPVVISGASGFLGSHLGAHLAGRGWEVRGLVRGDAPVAPGVTRAAITGLDDEAGLRRALEGAYAVVHLAARVHVMRDTTADPMAEHRRVNVEGTRALVRAAVEAGVPRFVFASSVKAVTGQSMDAILTPDTDPKPDDPYGITKLEAEKVLWSEGAPRLEAAAAIRLPAVYGPAMRGNVLNLFRLIEAGVPVPVGAVENCRSLLYVGNFAAAMARMLEQPPRSGTFFLRDGEDVSTADLVRRIARVLGRPPRMIRFSAGFLAALGGVGDRVAPLLRPGARPSDAFNRLTGSLCVDDSSFREQLDFQPPHTLDEGLAATAAWYVARPKS